VDGGQTGQREVSNLVDSPPSDRIVESWCRGRGGETPRRMPESRDADWLQDRGRAAASVLLEVILLKSCLPMQRQPEIRAAYGDTLLSLGVLLRLVWNDTVMRASIVLLTVALGGCASVYEPTHAGIPPGHMPPPGACRIWYPDRPPGHQPPPGPCEVLYWQVQPGAVLVRG
jgi:hypothetical protein